MPGLYAEHLERWLTHYPASQVGKEGYNQCVWMYILFSNKKKELASTGRLVWAKIKIK
jgi:hypothetical protein